MTYGIIAALDDEIELLIRRCQISSQSTVYGTTIYKGIIDGKNVVLCKCGIASINAALCTSILIREMGVDAVINTGIAGALGSGVTTLDVVISTEAVFHDKDTPILEKYYPFTTCFKADEALVRSAQKAAQNLVVDGRPVRLHTGRIATGDWFICDRQKKNQLVDAFHPLCAEMEGAAIANAAYLNACPFVIIRTMSDCADDDAHETYDNLIQRAANISASIVLKMLAAPDSDKED